MKVAVLFSRPKKWTLFSWLIRLWIKRDYSHCAILLNHGSHTLVNEASYGEVHLISLENWLKKNTIIKSKEIKLNPVDATLFGEKLLDSLQKPYGFKTVLGVVFRGVFGMGRDQDESFTCSEYASFLLPSHIENNKGDYISPADIERELWI